MPDAPESDAPPRAAMIAALVVALGALGAVLAVAATRDTPAQPIAITTVPAPQADGPECRALMATLPEQLGDFHRATTAEPTPAGAAPLQLVIPGQLVKPPRAWRRSGG